MSELGSLDDVISHTLNLFIIFKIKDLNACLICITIGILTRYQKFWIYAPQWYSELS